MILADKLVHLRKKSGMSQEELAEKMNVSRQAVSKWEGALSVPDLDRILQLSEIFGVTTDYLLKDEIESEEFTDSDSESSVRTVTMEQANEYLGLRKAASVRIALATFLCILSPIPLIVLGGASELPDVGISEDFAGVLGLVIMLILVAAAVGIFIHTDSRSAGFEFLGKEPFKTEYGVSGMVSERRKAYHGTYVKCNIVGTCICVLSPIPLFASALSGSDFMSVLMLAVTMIAAGIGAIFFIIAGVRAGSMDKLLKCGEFTEQNKKRSRVKRAVSSIYWSAAVAVYLLWLFLGDHGDHDNSYSWVVFPVAGVLFPAVLGICRLFIGGKNDEE